MSTIAGLQDFRQEGPPADIGTFQLPCSVLVFQHTFAGTTYICAVRAGDRGWVLVDIGTVASTVIQAGLAIAGDMFIVKAVYTIDVTLAPANSSITIEGEAVSWGSGLNSGTVLRAGAALAGYIIQATGQFFTLRNVALDGNNVAGVSGARIDAADGTFEHVTAEYCVFGLRSGSINCYIEDCLMEYCTSGLYATNRNLWVVRCIFHANVSYDLRFDGATAVWLINNRAEASGLFCWFESASNDLVSIGNRIYQAAGRAYNFDGNLSYSRIIGDVFDGNAVTVNFLYTAVACAITDVQVAFCTLRGQTGVMFNEVGGKVEKYHNGGYNPVGNVATPYPVAAGNLDDVAAAQAFPTSNVNYTVVGSPKLITIYGGTVTNIQVDGVVTGLTSGAFRLEPKQILKVVWTVQPSSLVYAQ